MGLLAEIWLSLVVVAFSIQTQVLNSQNLIKCHPNDLRALEGFMSELLEPSALGGWMSPNSSNCCDWVGITCNSSSNRVVSLQLPSHKLTGKLSESVSSLDQLKTLNLSDNSLKAFLPTSLFHLPHLQILDLSSNDFTGSFPLTINLPSIQIFNVSHNSFTGSIPSGICTNSTQIQILQLGVNYFNGSIPPQLGNCNSLELLSLATNHLSGTIPEVLFSLPKLVQLNLQDNLFTGKLSSNLSGGGEPSSRIERLDVSINGLSGSIPDFFHRFPNLTQFSAQSNSFTGGIPPSLANSRTISSLLLRNNSLHGLITLNCSAMINLVSLDLGTNQFSGSIPDNLPACPKLKAINLATNMLTGQISESFKDFHSLSFISVSNCSFTNISASLGILQHCPNLTTLIATQNFLNEELPFDNSLHFKALKVLIIAHSGLTGQIPQWLNGLTELNFLDLSWNRLTGTIPVFLGHFESLFYLALSNNTLTGEIPKSLTQLPSFISRDIQLQEPSPDFPIFKVRNVTIRGLQYNHAFRFPPTLDLSINSLSGPIWPEFGNLKRLHVLDLKLNNLSGNIPASLSGMTSIETMDLSNNSLTGTIPGSLVKLSFLSKFSVAYNNLSGRIPSAGQFSTFDNSSFEGNPGLCGEFFYHCQIDQAVIPKQDSKKKKKGSIISMPVWIGFGTGFLLAVTFLMILPAMRDTRRKKSYTTY